MTSQSKNASPTVNETLALFAQMDPPLAKVLQGMERDFENFSDLIANMLEPGLGDFDGYDGIENRGDIGDILASDWAIYELNQTEFLRRVAMREAIYRKKRYQTDTHGRAICLIVDSGAWMLGHSRLLGLGAVFWAASIAHRNNLEFYWRDTRDDIVWNSSLTRDDIETYLQSVSQSEMNQSRFDALTNTAPAQDVENVDFWFIGASETVVGLDLSPVNVTLSVTLPKYTGDVQKAESTVSFLNNGTLVRQTVFEFPEDGLCIGAMRRPFAPKVMDPAQLTSYLTDHWYADHWVELPSGRFVIRWPEGLLILRDFTPASEHHIWIPLPAKAAIIGISEDTDMTLRLLWLPDDAAGSDILSACIQWTEDKVVPTVRSLDFTHDGKVDLDFGTTALPIQIFGIADDTVPMYDAAGKEMLVNFAKGKIGHFVSATIMLGHDGSNTLRVRNTSDPLKWSNHTKQGTAYGDRCIGLQQFFDATKPSYDARSLISDIGMMVSFDGQQHTMITRNETFDFQLPHGIVPVQCLGPKTGNGYAQQTGGQVQFRIQNTGKVAIHPKSHKGTYTGLENLRLGYQGRHGYGVAMKEGKPVTLVRLNFGGKGAGFDALSVLDLIAGARTIRLQQ